MDDRGSVTIEMCFIAPILVCVVIMAIYMFAMVMNKSTAWRDACVLTYSCCKADDADAAGASAAEELQHELLFAQSVETECDIQEPEGQSAGENSVVVGYTEELRAVLWFAAGDRLCREICSAREVRDTAGNLRRWQNYGELLSD